jgi:chromosome segregation ATPase
VKHLFVVGRVYVQRNKAKEAVYKHLELMRKSIIKMRLSYTDIDILKEKIENLFNSERKYAKFFKLEDNETNELKKQLNSLQQELANEKTEKQRIIEENNEKMKQLTDSLDNIKSQMKHLLMEKAKRHQRLTALDKKIREKVDVHKYYH